MKNGAQLVTNTRGQRDAGNIEVSARSIRLENKAFLTSDTIAGQVSINLRSGDLVLRRGSNITANATDTAEDGNITIDAGIIAALKNRDISANAQNSRGARAIIDAQGIFGTEFPNRLTLESDITATSDLGPDIKSG